MKTDQLKENNSTTNNKRIAQNTLLLYIRTFITMIIALYTSRIVLQELGVEDFGIYNVVGGFVGMFALISATLTSSTQRFITFELGKKTNSHTQEIFSTAVIIHLSIALLIAILAESIGLWFLNEKMSIPPERLTAANWVFQFSLITFITNLISIPYNSAIIAHEKMAAFAYISLVEALLKLSIAYTLQINIYDNLILYGFLMLCTAVIIRLIYGIYCSRNFQESHFTFVREKKYYKQILGFSGWNILGSSSVVLTNYGINVLLNLFFGVATNAARGITSQVDNAVNQFVSNFTMAINPQITKAYAANNHSYMMKLVMLGARYSYYLLLLITLPILFETEYILNLWLNDVPNYTIIFIRLSICYSLCQSLSNTLYIAMLATGKIRNYQLVVGSLAIMSFPLAYIFFKMGFPPQFGYIATIIISVSCLIARLIMLRGMIKISIRAFFKDVICKICIVTPIASLIPFFITSIMPQGFIRLLLTIIMTMIFTSITILFIGISREERTYIAQQIKKKLNL